MRRGEREAGERGGEEEKGQEGKGVKKKREVEKTKRRRMESRSEDWQSGWLPVLYPDGGRPAHSDQHVSQ